MGSGADEEQAVEQAESAAGEALLLTLHAHHSDSGSTVIDTGGGVAETRFARRGGADRNKPFNIASYSLLTMMIAQVCELEPAEFVLSLGDAHLYLNHLEQVEMQLSREPYPLPSMRLDPGVESLFDFRYEHFRLENYRHHPAIRAPIAV